MLCCALRVAAALSFIAGCGASQDELPTPALVELTAPAGPGSSAPNLVTAPDGRVLLSWIEPGLDSTHLLRFSALDGEGWSEGRTIASGPNWFVNWADFPTLAALPDGRLAAHYLQRPDPGEGGSYAYHVRIVQSDDGGATWGPPITPHRDSTLTEHGFVSLFAAAGDSLGVVWLDGRAFAPEGGGTDQMSLRAVTVGRDGGLGAERVIDRRTCECCQTSAAVTRSGPVVAYRGRTPLEVRDIQLARWSPEGWTLGRPVHDDGWQIEACPVNGPAVASDGGKRVVVAWFTGARDSARVHVAFSDDEGESFAAPLRVDLGRPVGRVDVAMLPDGGALVSWIEGAAEEAADVLVRRIDRSGRRFEPLRVTTSSGARSSGFPHMAVSGGHVVFAWTDPSPPSTIRTARLELAATARTVD